MDLTKLWLRARFQLLDVPFQLFLFPEGGSYLSSLIFERGQGQVYIVPIISQFGYGRHQNLNFLYLSIPAQFS